MQLPARLRPKYIQIYLYILYAICLSAVTFLIPVLPRLRPIADDYCTGMFVAQKGVFGTVVYWYNDWSGYLFSNLLNSLIVGAPLHYFHFTFASSISFLISAFIIGITISSLFIEWGLTSNKLLSTLSFATIWILSLASGQIKQDDLHSTFLHWQTINAQYIIPQCFLIYGVFSIRKSQVHNHNLVTLLKTLACGLIAGLSSIQLSAMYIFMLFFITFSLSNCRKPSYELPRSLILTSVSATLTGFIIANFSPGNLIRYTTAQHIGGHLAQRLFEFSLHKGLFLYIRYCFKLPFVISAVMLFLLVLLDKKFINAPLSSCNLYFIKYSAVLFLCCGAFLSIFSGVLESFSYYGHWHMANAYFMAWIGILGTATWCASYLKTYPDAQYSLAFFRYSTISITSLLVLLMITVIIGVFITHSKVSQRYDKWQMAESPVAGATDSTWARSCYLNLLKAKNLPDSRFE